MGEVIAFEDLRKLADRCEVLTYFDRKHSQETVISPERDFGFPSSRPGVTGNLSDLFEQANAVAMRHYEGDPRVPGIVAEKCIELLTALTEHAEPE